MKRLRGLRDLIVAGRKVDDIALKMGKSKEAIFKKIERLGLRVVQQNWTTASKDKMMPNLSSFVIRPGWLAPTE